MIFKVLFLVFLVKISLAKTCEERLDRLENLLGSLMLRLEADKNEADDNTGTRKERLSETKPEKENQDLEKRVLQLEELLYYSNIQMDKVKARVLKLESKNQQLKARLTAKENNCDCEVSEKKTDVKTIFGNNVKKSAKQSVLLNENSVQVSLPSSPTKGEKFVKAQWNFSKSENINQPTNFKHSEKTNPFMNKTQNVSMEKRLLTGVHTTKPPFASGVAFSAYGSSYETDISKDHTIKFDRIVTNIGSHYNPHSGTFTAPQHGVYVFTWNLYCHAEGYIYSQIVVNSNAVVAMLTIAQGATNVRTTTGIVVVEVNQGDVVFVRTHPTESHTGNLFSTSSWRSSFNGWKIY